MLAWLHWPTVELRRGGLRQGVELSLPNGSRSGFLNRICDHVQELRLISTRPSASRAGPLLLVALQDVPRPLTRGAGIL